MLQVLEFLCRSCGSEQSPLKSSEKAMLRADRIEPMQIFLSMKDVDVVTLETGRQQCLDRRSSIV